MRLFAPRTSPRGLDALSRQHWLLLHQGHRRFARQPEVLQMEALRYLRQATMNTSQGPLTWKQASEKLEEAYRVAGLRPPRRLRRKRWARFRKAKTAG